MTEAVLSSQEALEAFLIDNPDLEQLEGLLAEFNLFEALGVVRQELRHSDFLGYLLDPRQNHGLADSFLTIFLRKAIRASDLTGLPFTAIDVTLWDLADTEVRREWRNIDLLVLNQTHKLAIIIENKVGSSEHSDQLRRYIDTVQREFPGWRTAGIYLTPEGDPPSEETFLPCSYGLVQDAIETLLESRAAVMGTEIRIVVSHYSQLLQRHVVSDSQIAELCRRIYRRHQQALDLIYEHRPDRAAIGLEVLQSVVQGAEAVRLDHCTKSYVRFVPTAWDVPQLRVGSGWTPTGRMLLFEFRNHQRRGIVLQLNLGPGPSEVRTALFEAAQESSLFAPTSKTLNQKWNALLSGRTVVSAASMEELDGDEVEAKVTDFWASFASHDMIDLVAELVPTIHSLPQVE